MDNLLKQKAAAVETPSVAVTPENMHVHGETPSDMLHGFVKTKLAQPDEMTGGDHAKLSVIAQHPNAQSPTLEALYNHYFPKQEPVDTDLGETASEGEEEIEWNARDVMGNILSHKNAPAKLAEDFLTRTRRSDDYRTKEAQEKAASHPGLSQDFLRQMTDQIIDDPEVGAGKVPTFNRLHPDYYFGLLDKRPMPEPETETMTDDQKKINRLADKIDTVFLEGLPSTPQHSPESINRAVDFYTHDTPYGMDTIRGHKLLQSKKDFIANQPGLTPQHLEKLIQTTPENEDNEHVLAQILKHPNVDSALVAKYAMKVSTAPSWSRDPVKQAALNSIKLPDETKNGILAQESITDEDAEGLLDNPKITPEDIVTIYNKSGISKSAVLHPKAPESLMDRYLEDHPKVEGARALLSRDTLPPAILSKIVSKNKNQDAAIEALKHKSVTMDVVNAGLKRRAPRVQDAAMRHPLVAKQLLVKNLKDGRINPYDFISDPSVKESLGEIPKEALEYMNDKYSSQKLRAEPELDKGADVWHVKNYLASQPEVPAEIKDQNRKDMVNRYLTNTKPDQVVGDSIDKMIGNMLVEMAHKGDIEAQMAAAQRPALLSQITFNNDKLSPEFLRASLDQLQKYHEQVLSSGSGFLSHRIDYGDHFLRMARNPNLDQDLFDKLTLAPKYLEKPSNYGASSGSYYYGNQRMTDKETETAFDDRYKDLPDDQKRAGFQKLLNPDQPDAIKALVRSRQAPTDMWKQAWHYMTPQGRQEFLANYHIGDYADDEILQNALLGKYNDRSYAASSQRGNKLNVFEPQMQALEALKPSNQAHRQYVRQFIKHITTKAIADSNMHIPNNMVIDHLEKDFFVGEPGRQLAMDAFENHSWLGLDLAMANTYWSYGKPSDYRDQTPEEQKPTVDKLRLNALKDMIEKGAEFDAPENRNKSINLSWDHAAHANKVGGVEVNLLRNIAGDASSPNGNLDFLMSMQGLYSDELRKTAAKFNLISHASLIGAAQQYPDLIDDALRSLKGGDASDAVKSFVEMPELPPAVLQAVVDKLSPYSFSYKHSRDALSDGDMESVKGYTDKLLNHILQQPDPGKYMDAMCSGLLASESKVHGSLPLQRKKELVNHIIDSVQNRDMHQSTKNILLNRLERTLSKSDMSRLVPASLHKMIVQNAIEGNDVDTLLRIADEGDAPASVMKQITKVFNNPDILNDDQLHRLSRMIGSDKVGAKQSRKVLEAMIQRRGQRQEEGMEDAVASMDHRIVEASKQTLDNINEDKDSPSFFLNTLLNYTMPGNPNRSTAFQHLWSAMDFNTGIALKTKVRLFNTLPDITPDEMNGGEPGWRRLSFRLTNDAVANNPDVIRNSVSGWRLVTMMHSADSLTKENANIIVNRAVGSTDPYIDDAAKADLAQGLMGGGIADDADVVKAIRNTSPLEQWNMLRNLDRVTRGSAHVLYPICLSQFEDTLNATQGTDIAFATPFGGDFKYMDQQHQDMMVSMMGDLARSLGPSAFYRDEKSSEYKNASLDESRVRFINSAKNLYGKIQSYIQTNASAADFEMITEHQKVFYDVASKLLSNENVQYGPAQSIDLLDMVSYGTNIAKAFTEKTGETMTPREPVNYSEDSWMTCCTVNSEQWKEVFAKRPELVHALGRRSRIDEHMLNAIDFTPYFTWDTDFADTIRLWPPQFSAEDAPKLTALLTDKVLESFKMPSKPDHPEVYYRHGLQFFRSAVYQSPAAFSLEKCQAIESAFQEGKNDAYAKTFQTEAVKSGAGGPKYLESLADSMIESWQKKKVKASDERLSAIAESPAITERVAGQMIAETGQQLESENARELLYALAKNKSITPVNVKAIVQLYKDNQKASEMSSLASYLMNNGGIDRESYIDLYHATQKRYKEEFMPGQDFNPAFTNPRWGGELFRSLPLKVPKNVPEVNSEALVTSAEYSQSKERLNQILAVIPPEGLSWVQFKKAYQKFQNWPEARSLFLSKPNAAVMPDDVAREMDKYDGYDFHVTYSSWAGSQRHREKEPNLVVQLNTSANMEKKLNRDPKLWAFFQMVQKAANRTADNHIGGHPVTPHVASWVRTDTAGGKKGWIVEEFQSDFGAHMHDQIEEIAKKYPGGFQVDGHSFTADEMHKYTNDIADAISGWYRASLNAMEDLARQQGAEYLYIHGAGPRATLSWMNKSKKLPVWLQEMYQKVPPQVGYEQCDYSDYPVKSAKFVNDVKAKGFDTKCWRKKLR